MNYLLCKHKVTNYGKWRRVFNTGAKELRKAGLRPLHIFRDVDDPKVIVLLFAASDLKKARAFTEAPDADDYIERSGIVGDAEIAFLRE